MRRRNRISDYVVGILLLVIGGGALATQPIKEQLFQEANAALQAAQLAQASVYAPNTYERAMKYYRSAGDRFERGKNLDSIRAGLASATEYFKQATELSRTTRLSLAALIKTRDDAHKVGAPGYAPDLWRQAEQNFSKAVLELERGAPEPAKQRAAEADRSYRDAELVAIKAVYLNDARALIARAEKEKIYKQAPKTLAHAQTLLQQAEKALTDNRYDTDLPRSLAQQAKHEAQHALYLAKLIDHAKNQKLTTEDVILDWETPVREIAAAADMNAEFDNGYRPPTDRIVAYIEQQQRHSQKLEQDVEQLQTEEAQLKQMLSGASAQRLALSQRLQEQAQVRRQFEQVENLFSPKEAQVLRESNSIVIRLLGLSFDVGQATIDAKNYQLLTKVQSAIQTFPGSKIIIEGHTDSYGSDNANYVLSQRRAEAVKEYLLANMRIDPSKIDAIGYGETQPIANNDTEEGRAKNRRIELVIRPTLSASN
jgi:OOP family OmpA-OmpF porin